MIEQKLSSAHVDDAILSFKVNYNLSDTVIR